VANCLQSYDYVELVAFAVIVPLSVGLAHAITRLMMNALLSALTQPYGDATSDERYARP
jgi:hypothetical protein